jgi:hypothetical protein
MSDDEKSKEVSPSAATMRQKLVDELLSASEKWKDGQGNVDAERLREEQLAILKKYDEQAEVLAEIFSKLGTDVSTGQNFLNRGARTLDELLVSKEPLPFDDISELSERFGPLPKGYSYRYLVPETRAVPREVADVANNVIRIPYTTNLLVKSHLDRHGDEIPDRSLGEWLDQQPAELVRLWSLRILSLFRILKASEVPVIGKRAAGSVPTVGARELSASNSAMPSPEIAAIVDEFREAAVFHYDGEEKESDVSILSGVIEKKDAFEKLKALGPDAVMALRPLLNDADIGVRVSAATYLLPSAREIAAPALQDVIANWLREKNEERAYSAVLHAKQTLWMYEDGNLQPGFDPPPREIAKKEVKLLDDDVPTLVKKFAEFAVKVADANEAEDRHRAASYISRLIAVVATLDARAPEGRLALAPLLDHPDPSVRGSAGTYLLKRMPEKVLPILEKLRELRDPTGAKHPRWRQASDSAWLALRLYESGDLNV